ncbi:MAG TPA: hypothetical protein VES42_13585 [Pilimelia sp.]|nr:hypothetical protein [Pilimelia sp.]
MTIHKGRSQSRVARGLAVTGLIAAAVLTAAAPAQADRVIQGSWLNITMPGGGDSFDNYDYRSTSRSPNNVDWAVNLIFTNNATVPKVKAVVSAVQPHAGSLMYSYVRGGWDQDRGLKQFPGAWGGGTCPGNHNYHFRVFAPSNTDRMYNVNLGYFVIGTSHNDYREGCSNGYAGDNEQAESHVATMYRTRGYAVREDYWNLYNRETIWDGPHHWNNDGYATQITIP